MQSEITKIFAILIHLSLIEFTNTQKKKEDLKQTQTYVHINKRLLNRSVHNPNQEYSRKHNIALHTIDPTNTLTQDSKMEI